MGVRTRQIDLTRNAILDAFLELTHAENAVNVSMPAVAEAADVSVRTVYRYFATKDELQNAAAFRMSERVLRNAEIGQVTGESAESYLGELWSGFERELPAVIAEHSTPAGRELRRTRLPANRATVARAMPDDVDAEQIDMIVAICSSSMFLELVDRMGYAPTEAAALVSRLLRILAEHHEEHR